MNSCLLVEYTRKGNLTVKSVYYSSHSLIGPFPNSSHAYAQPVSMVRYSRWKTLQECRKIILEKEKKMSEKMSEERKRSLTETIWQPIKNYGKVIKKILEFKLIT